MPDIPWGRPATVWHTTGWLQREPAAFSGVLLAAVEFVLAQGNAGGDDYVVTLDDGSASWRGPEIAALRDREGLG